MNNIKDSQRETQTSNECRLPETPDLGLSRRGFLKSAGGSGAACGVPISKRRFKTVGPECDLSAPEQTLTFVHVSDLHARYTPDGHATGARLGDRSLLMIVAAVGEERERILPPHRFRVPFEATVAVAMAVPKIRPVAR